jgi:hypothetical protein
MVFQFKELVKVAQYSDTRSAHSPLTMRDIDMAPSPLEMFQPMADACPRCGGFCMQAGDYICWGFCYRCYVVEEAKMHEELSRT